MSKVTNYSEFRRLLGEAELKKLAAEMGVDARSLTWKNRRALREALLRRHEPRQQKKRTPKRRTQGPNMGISNQPEIDEIA